MATGRGQPFYTDTPDMYIQVKIKMSYKNLVMQMDFFFKTIATRDYNFLDTLTESKDNKTNSKACRNEARTSPLFMFFYF